MPGANQTAHATRRTWCPPMQHAPPPPLLEADALVAVPQVYFRTPHPMRYRPHEPRQPLQGGETEQVCYVPAHMTKILHGDNKCALGHTLTFHKHAFIGGEKRPSECSMRRHAATLGHVDGEEGGGPHSHALKCGSAHWAHRWSGTSTEPAGPSPRDASSMVTGQHPPPRRPLG